MWPTPTPMPTAVLPTPPVDPSAFTAKIAENFLQGWQMFDNNSIGTLVWFIAVALIVFVGLMSIRRHIESL